MTREITTAIPKNCQEAGQQVFMIRRGPPVLPSIRSNMYRCGQGFYGLVLVPGCPGGVAFEAAWIDSTSTSKISVAFGPIKLPAPRSP